MKRDHPDPMALDFTLAHAVDCRNQYPMLH